MALRIKPKQSLDKMVAGEESAFSLSCIEELDGNTMASHTFKIYDSDGADVTANFGGGSSESAGVITFGIIAHAAGEYKIEFIITCTETLPDGITPNEFYLELSVVIE